MLTVNWHFTSWHLLGTKSVVSHDRLLILGLLFIYVHVPFCFYPVFLFHYSTIFPVFDIKVGSVSGCSPNGGAIMEDRSSRLLCCVEAAGGTSLI